MTDRRLGILKATMEPGTGDGEMHFTASAEGINRHGFSLRKSGWRLDNYNLNPVFLWMHMDFMPPIGRGRAVQGDNGLSLAVTFDRSDPFAQQIENKYRSGFLNAVSVGFDFVNEDGSPIAAWWRMDPEQINKQAFYDLAEVSAVPVPADPRAVKQRMSLSAMAEDLLDMAGLLSSDPDDLIHSLAGRLEYPQLPGNSAVEKRLANLENLIGEIQTKLNHTPVSEGSPSDTAHDLDPDVIQGLLGQLTLGGGK